MATVGTTTCVSMAGLRRWTVLAHARGARPTLPSASGTPALRVACAGWVCTPVCMKDVRKHDHGDARRLSFEERAERRAGKTREQKASREHLIQEVQLLVEQDFPDELESIYATVAERANMSAMKVLNMVKCLELLEIDAPGGQRKVPLTKVAQVVKVGDNTIEIAPMNATFATPILQRVNRFDSTLQISKEGTKIKVLIQPMTTARRDRAVQEVNALKSQFRQRAKQARTNASKIINDSGVDETVMMEMVQALDATVTTYVEEHIAELDDLIEQVESMGIDESDSAMP